MAVDAELWLILAAAVALICCGCIFTARPKKPLYLRDAGFDQEIDRAA